MIMDWRTTEITRNINFEVSLVKPGFLSKMRILFHTFKETRVPLYCFSMHYMALMSRAVASRSKVSCLGLALRNARWFESSWEKKFSHEISASVWDQCPPSIVKNLGIYDR
ncbi:hypothetical protein ANN_03294 [Periplaneta americana]|uniref:Uncharacterized protein n=1 Tax=Periplaneta americana TaxID=6978 RepID=A0ABQ8U2P6_PERAM|nr:hypothetical protein ANN_03294 [Periplaneta americana]